MLVNPGAQPSETAQAIVETAQPSHQTPPTSELSEGDRLKKIEELSGYTKRIWKEKQALRQEKERIAKEREELQTKYGKYMQLDQQKPDPLTLLQQYGYSYEDATQFLLNDNKPTAEHQVRSVKEELEAFKRQQAEEKQKLLEEQKRLAEQEEQEVKSQYRSSIDDFVEANKDEFELCYLFGGQQLIYDTAEEYYNRTGKIMNLKEVAAQVEDYLADEAKKIRQTKKFKSLYDLPQDPEQPQPTQGQRPVPSKTLNNQMITSSAPSMLPAKTENERLQRAMAALTRK